MSDYFNNVYMVGDVKQSIYKFRLACPELFMSKYDNYSSQNDNCKDTAQYNDCEDTSFGGGEQNISSCKIELQKNFRSRSNVLDSTNDVFFRVMNKNFCGIQYDDRQQLNCGLDYPACEDKRNFGQGSEKSTDIVLVDMSGDEDGDGIRAEARYAALRIRELMSEDNAYYVYDADLEDYRRIKYGDIVILTRTLTGWADVLVNELLDCGVPAMADTAQQYFKLREIKVLISLLTCIDNPLQDIPMASVLLSYFGGFTEDELCKIRISGKKPVCFIPYGEFDFLVNALISFVCALQVQTFRRVHGLPFASTMCTGNLRSGTDALFRSLFGKIPGELRKALHYYGVIVCFIFGAVSGALLLHRFGHYVFLLAPAGLCAVFFLIATRRGVASWRRSLRGVFRKLRG